MKRILIILTICLLLTGCVLPRRTTIRNSRITPTVITTNFGSYEIPTTWQKRDDHSTSVKYFFANKTDRNNPPNNISVEMGTNRYKQEDHLKFKDAILLQLGNQIKRSNMTLTSSGSTTKKGNIVYTFTMRGNNNSNITVQHYIIGDYKYVLVHETIFNGNENDVHNAANKIVNTFEWKK